MTSAPLGRTLGLSTLTTVSALAALACGGGSSPTEAPPPPPPPPPPSAEVKGQAIYALDLGNRLLLFGTESAGTIARNLPITGLPLLDRIVGIDFRPSNAKLYGVGTDSRVYIIDTLTAVATPVSSEPFTPKIARFFDVHFGMGFDPVTERIRLIAAESGANWSINPDDGTAVLQGTPYYTAGDPNEGKRIRIAGLAYVPVSASAASVRGRSASLAAGPPNWILEGLDAENGVLGEFIDVETGEFAGFGSIPGISAAACAEVKFDGLEDVWVIFQVTGTAIGLGTLLAFPTRSAVVKYVGGQIGGEIAKQLGLKAIQAFAFPPKKSSGSGTVLATRAEPQVSAMMGSEWAAQVPAAADPQAECTGSPGP